jgi:hypothetical protein
MGVVAADANWIQNLRYESQGLSLQIGPHRRGIARLTDLREAMSAFRPFMSASPPTADLNECTSLSLLLTRLGHLMVAMEL